jgi:hypothetical protein
LNHISQGCLTPLKDTKVRMIGIIFLLIARQTFTKTDLQTPAP